MWSIIYDPKTGMVDHDMTQSLDIGNPGRSRGQITAQTLSIKRHKLSSPFRSKLLT